MIAVRRRVNTWVGLLWAAMLLLLFLALRSTPLAEIWQVLSRLDGRQVFTLVGINGLILFLMAGRWWLVLRSLGYAVWLRSLLAYRLTGFAVSYYTPGPQFGGEPLQVDLLHREQKIPVEAALSSVFLDRLVDLLANFTILVLGVATIFLSGFAESGTFGWTWSVVIGLLLFPAGHFVALWRGRLPVTSLMERLSRSQNGARWLRVKDVVRKAEEQMSRLSREKPLALLRIILLSGVIWLLMGLEYWLSLNFLGIQPSFVEMICALTVMRLAFLAPLPGGIGVLEAGQILAMQSLGWGAAAGIAISLIIRARDLLLASAGIWIGGMLYRRVLLKPWITTERS